MNSEKWKFIGRAVIVTLGLCVVVQGGKLAAGTLTRDQHIEHGGTERFFQVFEPANMQAGLPLVLLLHGGGLSMDSAISPRSAGSEWLAMADEFGFVLMVPNGVNHKTGSGWGDRQHWNDCRGDDEVGVADNGCDPTPSESWRVPNSNRWDGSRAEYSIYTGPGDAKPVAFYRVLGGGHTVPTKAHPTRRLLLWLLGLGNQNRDFEGNRVAWAFLSGQHLSQ